MNEPPSLESVHLAVKTLHHSPDPHDKEKASAWLDQLQKSIHSWKLSDELLMRKLDVESCYFAAQTMRSKIRHSFHELPAELHASLRDSLLEHARAVTASTDAAIVTQLCLALADLALQMTAWSDPVGDLTDRFADDNPRALLEILTVIPEEACSVSLRLGENRRDELRRYLAARREPVDDFLRRTLEGAGGDAQLRCRLVTCLKSWIVGEATDLRTAAANPVVAEAFRSLADPGSSPTLHEASADCLCALLQRLEYADDPPTERLVFDGVASLEPAYHAAVAHEDQERAMNYARLFAELAEAFLAKIMDSPRDHFARDSLGLVLTCVGHHDYEVAEISFNLWYRLSEELYDKNDDRLSDGFRPYVERLIGALCRHCQMEPDHRDLLDKDDDFYDFRQKVYELTKDVVFIIGSGYCFRHFFLSAQTPDISWERTEAALFMMQAVAKNIVPDEYEYVPRVIEAILAMPDSAHVAVRHTSIRLLGELCEWIEKHPECIPPVFEYLLDAFKTPDLAPATAVSLQDICSACRHHMQKQLPQLLLIIRNLDSLGITNSAAVDLLKGVAAIIGFLPLDQITDAMFDACTAQIASFVTLNDQTLEMNGTEPTDPTVWLDKIATLFRNCKMNVPDGMPHPFIPVLSQLWPVFSTTMDKYNADLRIMERLCRCLRYAIRSLGKQGKMLLEPLSKKMVSIYVIHKHSCFLYLASILVDEFYQDQTCVFGLIEMLQSLIVPTFEVLQTDGLVQHPDTVDDLFRLCGRFLQRVPPHFVRSPATDAILQCGLTACSLSHKDANASVMRFLSDFVHTARSTQGEHDGYKELYSAKLLHHGGMLVANLLNASIFCLHYHMLHDVAGVVFELLKWNPITFKKYLEDGLDALSQRSNAATREQILKFHKDVMGAETEKDIVHALRDLVRLYN